MSIGSWAGQLLNGGSQQVKQSDNTQNNQGAGSGDGSGGDNNANQNNKGGDKGDLIDTIWKEAQVADNKNNAQNDNKQNGNGNNAQNNQQTDPAKQVSEFLNSQGLGEIKLSDAEIAQLKNGEGFQEVITNLNSRIQTGFVRAMSNANQLMDAKIEKALEKAQNDSKGFYQGEQLRNLIREKIPAARDEVVGPVAETVMRRLMQKGATIDQALDGTKKFFERSAKAFGYSQSNVNSNTRGSFGSSGGRNANGNDNQGNNNEDEGETNWLDLLKGN